MHIILKARAHCIFSKNNTVVLLFKILHNLDFPLIQLVSQLSTPLRFSCNFWIEYFFIVWQSNLFTFDSIFLHLFSKIIKVQAFYVCTQTIKILREGISKTIVCNNNISTVSIIQLCLERAINKSILVFAENRDRGQNECYL